MSALRILAVTTALLATFSAASAATGPFLTRSQASIRYGGVSFKIKVPAPPKTVVRARGIRPSYLSPSTESFVISTDGIPPAVANVDPSTGYATATIGHVTAGTHSFAVTAYDRTGGSGAILGVGDSGPVDVPAAGYGYVRLTLSGVVASVALILDYPNPTLGSPAVINLNVIAKDVDGNVILSSPDTTAAQYAQPLTLTTSDAVDGKLSVTTVRQETGIRDQFRVSVAYSGAVVSKVVFSAKGGGLSAKAVTPATLVPIAPPATGEQLIAQQADDPVYAFSTASHQLLGALGNPTLGDEGIYDNVAADAATGRIYIGSRSYPNESIDIFAGGGAYRLIDSIAFPNTQLGGIAVDSAGGQLFVGVQGSRAASVSVLRTSASHAMLGTIPYDGSGTPNLAVDATAGRLYAAGCSNNFGCTGFEVFSTKPPYRKLGSYGQKPYATGYCSVAADTVSGRLFLSECTLPNENPSYVDVYEAADLNVRIARIGPLTPAAKIAIDSKARVLYVTRRPPEALAYDSFVDMYALDRSFSPIGSLPVRSVGNITVAPYLK